MYRPSSYWSSTLLDVVLTRAFRKSKNYLFTICICPAMVRAPPRRLEVEPPSSLPEAAPKRSETRFTSTANR